MSGQYPSELKHWGAFAIKAGQLWDFTKWLQAEEEEEAEEEDVLM